MYQALAAMWEDYVLKLTHQVQDPLAAYVARFPEVKVSFLSSNQILNFYFQKIAVVILIVVIIISVVVVVVNVAIILIHSNTIDKCRKL